MRLPSADFESDFRPFVECRTEAHKIAIRVLFTYRYRIA
jgi:hypothetical protein